MEAQLQTVSFSEFQQQTKVNTGGRRWHEQPGSCIYLCIGAMQCTRWRWHCTWTAFLSHSEWVRRV